MEQLLVGRKHQNQIRFMCWLRYNLSSLSQRRSDFTTVEVHYLEIVHLN